MSDVFKAIADPTRREILLMIAQQPQSVNSIAEHFSMSRPAVSKHIKVLQDNQLAYTKTDAIDGRQRNCYAQLEALAEVNDYLDKLQKFWQAKLDNLDTFLAKRDQEKDDAG